MKKLTKHCKHSVDISSLKCNVLFDMNKTRSFITFAITSNKDVCPLEGNGEDVKSSDMVERSQSPCK